jgi:hypothetical protein
LGISLTGIEEMIENSLGLERKDERE